MEKRTIVLVLILATLLAGCDDVGSTSDSEEANVGKYEQTWKETYAETNCGEWLNEMNHHERFVAAADMLVGVWKVDGVEGELPADGLVRSFSANISKACEANSEIAVSEVGATLYVTAKDQFGPP